MLKEMKAEVRPLDLAASSCCWLHHVQVGELWRKEGALRKPQQGWRQFGSFSSAEGR